MCPLASRVPYDGCSERIINAHRCYHSRANGEPHSIHHPYAVGHTGAWLIPSPLSNTRAKHGPHTIGSANTK